MSVFGAEEDDGTYDNLKRIAGLCRPPELPATTPFKFSMFDRAYGGRELMSERDLQFWKRYSEIWFKDRPHEPVV